MDLYRYIMWANINNNNNQNIHTFKRISSFRQRGSSAHVVPFFLTHNHLAWLTRMYWVRELAFTVHTVCIFCNWINGIICARDGSKQAIEKANTVWYHTQNTEIQQKCRFNGVCWRHARSLSLSLSRTVAHPLLPPPSVVYATVLWSMQCTCVCVCMFSFLW